MIVDGQMVGYYILHPNNIGRCSHVANASYVLSKEMRGRHLGRNLVHASVEQGNLFACQFHPEKSSEIGLAILKNFAELPEKGAQVC